MFFWKFNRQESEDPFHCKFNTLLSPPDCYVMFTFRKRPLYLLKGISCPINITLSHQIRCHIFTISPHLISGFSIQYQLPFSKNTLFEPSSLILSFIFSISFKKVSSLSNKITESSVISSINGGRFFNLSTVYTIGIIL